MATRIYSKGNTLFLHMKHHGYEDKADRLKKLGPLWVVATNAKKIKSAVCFSPDRPGSKKLNFTQKGSLVRLKVPVLEYYNLIVIETK